MLPVSCERVWAEVEACHFVSYIAQQTGIKSVQYIKPSDARVTYTISNQIFNLLNLIWPVLHEVTHFLLRVEHYIDVPHTLVSVR